jgi:hypothetical protein
MIPTAIAGLWLLFVIGTVLPVRDPAQIPMWTAVVIVCCLLLLTSWACLRIERPNATWRAALVALSAAALAFGLYATASMLSAPAARFEGYVLLIGVILTAHGLVGLLYSGLIGRMGPREERAAG